MRNSIAFIKVLVLAVSVLVAPTVLASGAEAQATRVVIVDQNYVVANSMALKDINSKVAAFGEQLNAELEPRSRALKDEAQQLSIRAGNRTQDELATDAGYVSAASALARKSSSLQEESLISEQELQATQDTAYQKLADAMKAAIDDVRNENGAHLVLDKTAAASFVDAIDVTQPVLAKLNERAPTIDVVLKEFSDDERMTLLNAVAQQQMQQTQQLVRQGLAQNRALNAIASAAQQEQGAAGN